MYANKTIIDIKFNIKKREINSDQVAKKSNEELNSPKLKFQFKFEHTEKP